MVISVISGVISVISGNRVTDDGAYTECFDRSLEGYRLFRSYSLSDPGSFRSCSLLVWSLWPDCRDGSFRPNFGGSFQPTLLSVF